MTRYLAIDPGRTTGAAAWGDGRVVRGWAEWRTRDGAIELRGNGSGWTGSWATLHEVGVALATWVRGPGDLVLVVEGLFVGPNPKTALGTAEAAALVYGPCLGQASQLLRPVANGRGTGWRDVVLGRLPARHLRGPRGGTRRKAAAWAQYALEVAPTLLGWEQPMPRSEHVAEAALMMRWAHRTAAARDHPRQ